MQINPASGSIPDGRQQGVVTGDPVPSNRIPIVGMFYSKTNSEQGVRAKYYTVVRDINLAERKFKGLAASGGDIDAFIAERPESLLYKTADSIGRDISSQTRLRATLTADDKDLKKTIDQDILGMQSLLIDLYEQAKAEAK